MKKLFSLVCVLAVSMFVLGCAEEKKPATPAKTGTTTETTKEVKKEEVKKDAGAPEVKTEEVKKEETKKEETK